jgi:hypothetical protein
MRTSRVRSIGRRKRGAHAVSNGDWWRALAFGVLGVAVGYFTRYGLSRWRAKAEASETPEPPDDFKVSDAVSQLEDRFPFKDLLSLDYFRRYRKGYYDLRQHGWQVPLRNYCTLLEYLTDIHEYSAEDASSFAKKFRTGNADWRNGEAVFAEVIVYRYYVRLVYEGIISNVLVGRDCDTVVQRLDGSSAYLEVFCIQPDFPTSEGGEPVVFDIKTHSQNAKSSVRQKLLHKIREQHQMTARRDNYAVIELNDVSIAGSFAVLSSLSGGYKVHLDRDTGRQVDAGYDWAESVFADEATRHLKGVIWFSLGDYESRHFLMNPSFDGGPAANAPAP